MSAMVDGATWVRAATETGQAIMVSLTRAGVDPRPFGHLVSYVTGTFRDVVKAVAGALPKKVAEDAWRIGMVGNRGGHTSATRSSTSLTRTPVSPI